MIVSVSMDRERTKGGPPTAYERAQILVWAGTMYYEDVPQALKVAQANVRCSMSSDEPALFTRRHAVVSGPEL